MAIAMCGVMCLASVTPTMTQNSWNPLRKKGIFTTIHKTRALRTWQNWEHVTALEIKTFPAGTGDVILWKARFQKRGHRTKSSTFLRPAHRGERHVAQTTAVFSVSLWVWSKSPNVAYGRQLRHRANGHRQRFVNVCINGNTWPSTNKIQTSL